jgi:hypothetical protein
MLQNAGNRQYNSPWSELLLTRKHCPKQTGRYPGFSPSIPRLLRHFCPMALRRKIVNCDLQLRDSSRFARDSLLAVLFDRTEPDCLFFQSAVALICIRYHRSVNADAKIRQLYGLANIFERKMYCAEKRRLLLF